MAKATSELDGNRRRGKYGTTVRQTVRTSARPAATGRVGRRLDVFGKGEISRDLQADLTKEYVASGSYLWLNLYLRSLPWHIDDVTEAFGDDVYERMLKDPVVAAAFLTLKSAILREGIDFLSAEDERDWKKPVVTLPGTKRPRQSSDKAREVAAFCRYAMDNMERDLEDVAFEMLDCAAFGNKVGEKIYADPLETGPWQGYHTLRRIKVKPRRSVAFVVDAYSNMVGLLGLIPGQGYPVIVQGIIGPPNAIPNLLPRDLFCILQWMPRNEDPRGNSQFYHAYSPWWFKQQTRGERLKHIARFGSPSVWGTPGPDATPVQATNPDGTVQTNTDGTPKMQVPVQYMFNALQAFKNGTALAAPHGSEVNIMESTGKGEAFKFAIEDCDREIRQAILYQTLASGEAQNGNLGSGSGANVHQDIMELPVAYGKRRLARMIVRDILMQLVSVNFGDECLPLTPTVSLGDVESHNFADMGRTLASMGYRLDPSQFAGIDADLGLPERTSVEDSPDGEDPDDKENEDAD